MRFLPQRIKENLIAMFPQLGRVPLATLVADELYQAERDLLNAELNAEHWTAQRNMLQTRAARLRGGGDGRKDASQGRLEVSGRSSFGEAYAVGRK